MDLKERFLKYVSYDTQSSEESGTFPSTEKQKVLLDALRDEIQQVKARRPMSASPSRQTWRRSQP